MFNRKLKERIERLERLVDGRDDTRAVGLFFGTVCEFGDPGIAGLRDKVDAISARFGIEYKRVPATQGGWVAVDKCKAKARKR